MKYISTNEGSDVLTAVLNPLQFKSQIFCYGEFTAPWAVKLPASDFAHFHVCERGQGWLKLAESESQISLASGDLVILPHGNAHVLRDNPKSRAVTAVTLDKLLKQRSLKDHIVLYGGGGSETTVVCGSFQFENQIGNPIISLLPTLIHVPHNDTRTGVCQKPMLKVLAHEAQNPSEGSGSIISHLTALLSQRFVSRWR